MSFPAKVKEDALVACQRWCCVCHKHAGISMEVHHIIQEADGGENTFENAIPLCSNCHALVGSYNPHHPRGNKFSPGELKRLRDDWYKKIKETPPYIATDEAREIDRETYNQLKQYLPVDRLEKIRDIEFGGCKYHYEFFDPLEKFINASQNPLFAYMDAELEKSKMQLVESIRKYFSHSSEYIFSNDGEYCLIPPEWEFRFPEKYIKAVETLNEDTTEIWNCYCLYIGTCRQRLQISGR